MDNGLMDGELPVIDDCWKRIGVYGDKSCERLAKHVHCRNCEVYADAAVVLLDRYGALHQSTDEAVDAASEAVVGESRSTLIFRLGDEWLGLATRSLVAVVARTPIHSLPHQRTRSLLGVTNVNGALVACISLSELLGLDGETAAPLERRVIARMLILHGADGALVAPVDEVEGIHLLPLAAVVPASRAGGQSAGQFASGVILWRGRSITLLDEPLLQQAMVRSLQ